MSTEIAGFAIEAESAVSSAKHSCKLPTLSQVESAALKRGTILVCRESISETKDGKTVTRECGRKWKLNLPRKLFSSVRPPSEKKTTEAKKK